jgi:hypothetical protein
MYQILRRFIHGKFPLHTISIQWKSSFEGSATSKKIEEFMRSELEHREGSKKLEERLEWEYSLANGKQCWKAKKSVLQLPPSYASPFSYVPANASPFVSPGPEF